MCVWCDVCGVWCVCGVMCGVMCVVCGVMCGVMCGVTCGVCVHVCKYELRQLTNYLITNCLSPAFMQYTINIVLMLMNVELQCLNDNFFMRDRDCV